MHHIPNRPIRITIPNLRLTEPIQLPRTQRIQINRKRKRDEESSQRHTHGDMVPLVIGHQPRESREQRPAGHGRHDPRRAALRVATEPADREREDGGEDAGFEEEDEGEGRDSGFAAGAHGRGDEDDDAREEEEEDPARFRDHHGAGGGEAADGEEALRDGVAVRARGCADVGALDGVFDELRRDAYLGADVAELRRDAEEELVLFAHGLVDVAG